MIDPFVSLFMNQEDPFYGQNEAPSHITVEEAIDCRNSNARFFSLYDKQSQLSIRINDNSTITSCNLAEHEFVVDTSLYHEQHESWAVGDRPFQKLSALPWTSHVRGSELILSSYSTTSSASNNNNPHTSLHFELTGANELHCVAKLRTIHLQHQVFYYNLKQTQSERAPIDGHTIVVRCNGNLNRIQAQPTRLLCHCNRGTPVVQPHSIIGDIPVELYRHPEDANSDDLLLCDAIYCLESYIGSPDYLQAQLQFQNKVLVFEVRSAKSSTAAVSQPTNPTSVSSSSASNPAPTAPAPSSFEDLKHPVGSFAPQSSESKFLVGGMPGGPCDDSVASSSSPNFGGPKRMKLEPLDSTSSCNRSSDVSTSHATTMLRLRVRITNFGVSILPIMMTNYATKLSFNVM